MTGVTLHSRMRRGLRGAIERESERDGGRGREGLRDAMSEIERDRGRGREGLRDAIERKRER